MPIYEFYCKKCHMIFNFSLQRSTRTRDRSAPSAARSNWNGDVAFSRVRQRGEEEDSPMPDIDESKLEHAMNLLGREAETLDENDPKQAANLMRKLSDMTGMNLGSGMEEACGGWKQAKIRSRSSRKWRSFGRRRPFSFRTRSGQGLKRRPPAKTKRSTSCEKNATLEEHCVEERFA